MTTDLRAALREAIFIIGHFPTTQLADEAVGRLKALADAPPTVAELLPMVDAEHDVEWTGADGDPWRAALGDHDRIDFMWRDRHGWNPGVMMPADLTQPARLVEVG